MQGLKRKPTYNELIEQVENSDDIIKKYPDRRALFMRNHPYLTTLDGECFMDALDAQQDATIKEQQKDMMIRTYSAQTGTSHLENKTMMTTPRKRFAWRDKQQQFPSPENEFGTPARPLEDPMSGVIGRAVDDVQEELENRAKDHADKKARQRERLAKRVREIQTPYKSLNPFSDEDMPDPESSSSGTYTLLTLGKKAASGAKTLGSHVIPPTIDFGGFLLKEGDKRAISAAPSLAKGLAIGAYKGTKGALQVGKMLGQAIAKTTHKKQKTTDNDAPVMTRRRPASPQHRQPVARPLVFDMAKDDEPESTPPPKGQRGRPRKIQTTGS
jgi:hypothetical protein